MTDNNFLSLRIAILDLMHLAKYAMGDTATEQDVRIYKQQADRVQSLIDAEYKARGFQ